MLFGFMGRLVGFVDVCNVREFLDLLMGFGIFIKLDIFEPYVLYNREWLFVFLRSLVRLFDNIEEFLDLLLGFHFVELVIFVRTWQNFCFYHWYSFCQITYLCILYTHWLTKFFDKRRTLLKSSTIYYNQMQLDATEYNLNNRVHLLHDIQQTRSILKSGRNAASFVPVRGHAGPTRAPWPPSTRERRVQGAVEGTFICSSRLGLPFLPAGHR